MTDIIFPQDNEQAIEAMAKRIGIEKLLYVYSFARYKTSKAQIKAIVYDLKSITQLQKNPGLTSLVPGELVTQHLVEHSKNLILYNLESSTKRDKLNQRNSGLNHIICKFAQKNNTKVCFLLSSYLNAPNHLKPVVLGRMMANIKLCRKYNVPMIIGSGATSPYELRSFHDLKSFFINLGMHPSEIKNEQIL